MKLQFKQVVVAYLITVLVSGPAMAQQQTADLVQRQMRNQQLSVLAEKLPVDRQTQAQLVVQLADSETELKEALNGTTVVDIATPSAKGVSKNNWNEFNVGEEGIIFNNSKGPVLTQLGGWSDGNRRLAGGEAEIILNQVNGANRSSLLGQIEIAGKSAEFILANPNGITCNGCGFINTPSVSLITGQSRFSTNGDLIFDVAGGDFLLEGAGLNASNISRFDIVSRYAKINADLYANELNLITGQNEFNYANKQLTANSDNANANLQFAFDSTALGGMYANRIRLVGTEKGLGVNLEGIVQSTDELQISADGDIQLKQTQANNKIQLTSTSGDITNRGTLYSADIDLHATSINNQGLLASSDKLQLTGKTIIQAGNLYAGLTNQNQLNYTGSLVINAEGIFENQNTLYVGGVLTINTPTLDNSGTWVLQTQGELNLNQLFNSGSIHFNNEAVSIQSTQLTNTGDIQHLGSGLLTLNIQNDFANQGGLLATNGDLRFTANNLLNIDGEIFADNANVDVNLLDNSAGVIELGSLNLTATRVNNQDGRLILTDSAANQQFTIEEQFTNQSGVVYATGETVSLSAQHLDNQQGNFILNNNSTADLALSNGINNQSGFLQSADVSITTGLFNNTQGKWLSEKNQSNINYLINDRGFIQGTDFKLTGDNFDNQAGVLLNIEETQPGNMVLNFSALSNINEGVIRNLNGNINITTGLLSNAGVVDANNNLELNLDQLFNLGSLQARQQMQINANAVDNQSGYIASDVIAANVTSEWNNTLGYVEAEELNLHAASLNNQQGFLLSKNNTNIELSEDLSNLFGVIANTGATAENFSITANNLDNAGEIISNATNASITLSDKLINTGVIENSESLDINATSITNTAGSISAADLILSADVIENQSTNIDKELQQGQIAANQITLNTNEFSNAIYSLIYAGDLTTSDQTTALISNDGDLVADHIELSGSQLTNGGRILSATDNDDFLVLNFLTSITNTGQISRNHDWSITTNEFINNGRIESLGSGTLKANTIVNTDLQKQTVNDSTVAITNNGFISASELVISTTDLDNRFGVLIGDLSPPPNLPLGKGEGFVLSSFENSYLQLNNQSGFIQSGSTDWALNNIHLVNTGGTLWHSGSGNAEVNLLGNLDNTEGSIISEGNLQIRLQDANSVLINNAGLIQATNLNIVTTQSINNTNAGSLTGNSIDLTTSIINNTGGIIEANGTDNAILNLQATYINNKQEGEIRSAARDWNLSLSNLDNDGGSIIHTGAGQLSIESTNELINNGTLFSSGELLLDLDSLINNQHIQANNLSILTQQSFNNSGNILANALTLNGESTDQEFANAGLMQANQFNLTNVYLLNAAEGIVSGVGNNANFIFNSSQITNNGIWANAATDWNLQNIIGDGQFIHKGTGLFSLGFNQNNALAGTTYFHTDGSADLTGTIHGGISTINGEEQRTTIFAEKDISLGNNFINQGAWINTNQNLIIEGNLRNERDGRLVAIGNLTNNSANPMDFTNQGDIQANSFTLTVDQLINSGSLLASGKGNSVISSITATELNNTDGLIAAEESGLSINSTRVINQQTAAAINTARGIYANRLTLTADTLDNRSGVISINSIAASSYQNLINIDDLINTAGTIQLSHFEQNSAQLDSLAITANNRIDNQGGKIHLLNLIENPAPNEENPEDIINLAGENQLQIQTAMLDNENGNITSDGKLIIHSQQADNTKTQLTNAGLLQAMDDLTINAAGLNNSDQIIGGGNSNVTLDLEGFNVSNSNLIQSKNVLNIYAHDVRNEKDIVALNNLQVSANSISLLSNIQSGNLLTLDLKTDLTVNQNESIIASGALSLITPNSITNNGIINTQNQLLLTTGQLINNATGKIIAGAGQASLDTEGNLIFEPSVFNIHNRIDNVGTISVMGVLDINTPLFNNQTSGRVIAGGAWFQNESGQSSFENVGGLKINLSPADNTNTGSLINEGIIFSHGDISIKNAAQILNQSNAYSVLEQKNAEIIAYYNIDFEGNALKNNQARIEAINGNVILDIKDHLLNESSVPPQLIQHVYQTGTGFNLINTGSNLDSDACIGGNGYCEVDEQVNTQPCHDMQSCSMYNEALARNETWAVSLRRQYTLDLNSASIWGNIVSNRGKLIYEYDAKLASSSYQLASIIAGNNVSILGTQIIENIYGSIYAGNDLDINGGNLTPLSQEFKIGTGTVEMQVNGASCKSESTPNYACAYYWHGIEAPDNLESLFYGFIRAGGDIKGDLASIAKDSERPGTKTDANTQTSETPNDTSAVDSTFEDAVNELADSDVANYFHIREKDDEDTTPLDPKTLEDLTSTDTADGAGTSAQNSTFAGETGEQADANEKALLNDAEDTSNTLTENIPEAVAKATEQELKVNQWPLISFTVLPFNFDLNNLSALYVVSKNPESKYLIETRPEFITYEKFLGSDYLLEALGYDADKTIKRLGDAFFENMLMRDALIKETNSRYIGDFTNDHDVMQYLMKNAVNNAQSLELTIGVALTPEQSAALTQDMMWLVKKKINGEEVLVPHLYLTSVSPEKIAASKAAIGANGSIALTAKSIDNQNNMYAGNNLSLTADLLKNTSSLGAGGNLLLATRGDLQQDGRLFAQGDVRLLAASSISNNGSINGNNVVAIAQNMLSNSKAGSINAEQQVLLQSTQDSIYNTGKVSGANATLDAGRDIHLNGNGLSASNNIALLAKQDVVLHAEKAETNTSTKKIKANTVQYTSINLNAGGNVLMDAGRDIQLEGADINAGGDVGLYAGRNVNLQAMKNEDNYQFKAKRKKVIHNTTEHDVVNINSGGSVTVDAGQDASLIGTNIAANDDIYLSADRDTNISAVVDSDYDYYYRKKKKSFGRSKTKIDETLVETVTGGTVAAGGNIMINAVADEAGNIGLTNSRNLNINGAVIASDEGDVVLAAKDNVTLGTVDVNSIDYHLRKKSGTGGFTGKSKSSKNNSTEKIGTQIQSGNDAVVLAGNNATLISSAIQTENDIQLEAGLINEEGNLNLLAADNSYLNEKKKSKKSMSLKVDKDGMTFDKTTKNARDNTDTYRMGNLLSTGSDVNLSAARDINVEGSTITGKNIDADAGRDVNLIAAQDDVKSGQERSVSRNGFSMSDNSNGVSVFAGEETNKDRLETRDKVSVSTVFNSTENTVINAERDINLASSEINSEKSITLDAKRNVTVGTSEEYYQSINEHENIKDGLTVTANHNLGNTAKAFESLGDMGGNGVNDASTAMRAMDAISNSGPSASAHLGRTTIGQKQTDTNVIALGSQLNAKENIDIIAGETATIHGSDLNAKRNITVDATDINILASENETDSKSKDSYHKTGVDVNAAGGNVSITGGFTMSSSEMKTKDITANASQLNADNISLIAKNDVNVKGSDLLATNDIAIDAGRDVNILSADEYTRSEFDSEYKSFNAGVNIGAGGVGVTVNGSIGEEELNRTNVTHRNSQINAAGKLSITSGNDTTIKGANVSGKDVDVNVGNNLTVASEQNTGDVRGHKYDASFSLTIGAGVSGSVSGGYGETEGSSAWTANQTSLTGSNSINVNVKNHTQLDGAVLGNMTIDEDGNKTADENFNFTTKTFGYSDLKDHDKEKSTYVGVSIGFSSGGGGNGGSGGDGKASGSFGIDAQYSSHNKQQDTFATLGNGNINIQSDIDNGTNSLAGINRDLTQTQIVTKDKSRNYDVYVNSNTIDTLTDDSKRAQLVDRMTSPGRMVGEAFQFGEIVDSVDNAFAITANGEIQAPTDDQLKGMSQEQKDIAWADYYDKKENQGVIKTSSAQNFDNGVYDFSIATQDTILSKNHDGGINFFGLGQDNNLLQNYERNQFSRVTTDDARNKASNGYQYQTYDGQIKDGVDVLNNATAYGVDTNQFAMQLFVDGMSNTTDFDALLYSKAPSAGLPKDAKGVAVVNNENGINIVGVNIDKTNTKNHSEFITTIAEETYHNMNPDDHQANLFAEHSARLWNDANVEGGRTTGQGVGIKQWREDNKNNPTIAQNNVTIGSQRARDMEFRQLQLPELKYIKDNSKFYAVEQGITEDQARRELTQQALLMVDKTWADQPHIQENSDARDFLTRYTAGQEFDILTQNGIEKTGMFNPTESQFNNFELGQKQVRLLDDPYINSNLKPITEFENWITNYGTENGSNFNLRTNITVEMSHDVSETATGISGYVDKHGWSTIPQFASDIWNGTINSVKTTYDNWQTSGVHAFVPDSQSTGSSLDNAYFANLIGNQQSFDNGMTGNAYGVAGGLSAGSGTGLFIKSGTKSVTENIVDTDNSIWRLDESLYDDDLFEQKFNNLHSLTESAFNIYSLELPYAVDLTKSLIGSDSIVTGRAKEVGSATNRLQRALDNGWTDEINTPEQAIDNLWDAVGTRIVIEDPTPQNIDNLVNNLCDAMCQGKINITKVNSLVGENGVPYLTNNHLLQFDEVANSLDHSVVTKMISYDSGYTAGMVYIRYPSGVRGELQILGPNVLEISNAEHLPYDAFLNKPYAGAFPESNLRLASNQLDPIRTAAQALTPTQKDIYLDYLNKNYINARLLETGQPVNPIELPTELPDVLRLEHLIDVNKRLDDLKK